VNLVEYHIKKNYDLTFDEGYEKGDWHLPSLFFFKCWWN